MESMILPIGNPRIQSVGLVLGGEQGLPIFGIAGPSGGGGVMLAFSGNSPQSLSLSSCRAYVVIG